jgi:predicted tellurium resistance membrane protein TerC
MNKMFRILEIFWLVLGFIGVIMCAVSIVTKDSKGAIYFLVVTFASGLMYAVRKRQRTKYETAEKNKEQKK